MIEEANSLDDAQVFEANNLATIHEISPEESEKILQQTEIHGDSFQGRSLTTELLRESGLSPQYSIGVGGRTFWFSSRAYELGKKDRPAVVGYLKLNKDKMVARSYYQSNSSGLWRYLPKYTLNQQGKIDWFSKGYGEESLNLNFEVQKALADLVKNKSTVDDPYLIFAGTAREEKFNNQPDSYIGEVDSVPDILSPNFVDADPMGISYPRNKLSPESLVFDDSLDGPDFTKRSLFWEFDSNLYGSVSAEVFPSQNEVYRFMFCRDNLGRAWVAAVEKRGQTGTTGLFPEWVNAGDLTTPAFEYARMSGQYGNFSKSSGSYVDMFDFYLSKIPVIQEYLSKTGDKPQSIVVPKKHEVAGLVTVFTGDTDFFSGIEDIYEMLGLLNSGRITVKFDGKTFSSSQLKNMIAEGDVNSLPESGGFRQKIKEFLDTGGS